MSEAAHLAGPEQRKRIWIVFWILFFITVAEFIIAFTMESGLTRTSIFMGMTVVKAFYIVAEFMHLKHEVKNLILSLLLPLVFILWLIIAMMVEGNWYNGGWFKFMLG